jgi:ATP-dependent DNA helicase RecG
VEQLGEPGSISRNPALAAILHETHLAETKGSGIRVMRALMEKAGLELPQFTSDRHNDEFMAQYLFHHFLSEQDVEWLGRFKGLPLTNDQHKALIFARETGSVSNREYRELNRVNIVEASQQLCGMRDLGVLDSIGSGRATYYVLSDKYGSRPKQPTIFDMIEEKTSKALVSSEAAVEEPTKPAEEPTKPGAASGTPPEGPLSFEALRKACEEALGIPADSSPRGEDTKRAILYLCLHRPCSTRQLADALGKNSQYLSKEYIAPMVKAGELEPMFPDSPRHPQQAYRAVARAEGEES